MSEIIKEILKSCDMAKIDTLVEAYGKALLGQADENQLAEQLNTAKKEELIIYILKGFEAIKKTYGKQLKILYDKYGENMMGKLI